MSREQILNALKQGQAALPPVPMPSIPVAALTPHFAKVEPELWQNDDPNELISPALISQFCQMLEKVGGQLIKVESLAGIQTLLDCWMSGAQILSQVSGLEGNCELTGSPHDLAQLDYALVIGQIGVAENGAIFIPQAHTQERVLPYITEHLLVVIRERDIVPTMHQAVPAINLPRGHHGCFIAGPSKTADIEQSLVIGAHGACALTVLLLP